jgi:hypothetical protein
MSLTRSRISIAIGALIVVIALLLLLFRCQSSSASGPIGLPYLSSGWAYRQVAHDGQKGFEKTGFDTSTWTTGQAGFGTTGDRCPWNNAKKIHTNWDVNTDILLRHDFRAQTSPGTMHITGTIDNNADVYVNGTLVQHVESGYCSPDAINVVIPAKLLHDGGGNVIAIRAIDLGDASYIDVEIVYVAQPSPSPS